MDPVVYDPGLLCGGRGHCHSPDLDDVVLLCQSPRVLRGRQKTQGRQDKSEERAH